MLRRIDSTRRSGRNVPRSTSCVRRRGGILFEVVLSLGLFIAAAGFTLSSMRTATSRIMQDGKQQMAVDLCSSLMAELEAGFLTASNLRDGLPRAIGSNDRFQEQVDEAMDLGQSGWDVDVHTEPSEYPGLSLVEITVTEILPGGFELADGLDVGSDLEAAPASWTLRRLMKLREADPDAFEEDDMLDGLPEEERGRS